MESNGEFSWGIMGTGKMARQFLDDLRLLPYASVTAVGSRRQHSADDFAEKRGIPTAHGSYEALATDDNVDIVYVATPQSRHAEDVRLALQAGKHVLCEKPLTVNAHLSEELASLARKRELFLMEALWTRFLPIFRRVSNMVERHIIGEPQMLIADIGAYVPFDPAHRMYDIKLGGGALLDLGIYPIQLAFQFFGQPQKIASQASIGESGVDEQSSYLFNYRDGQQAVLAASCRTNGRREAVVAGPKGKLTIHAPWWKATACTVEMDDGDEQYISMPYEGLGYQFEAAHVMTCLSDGKTESPVMPLDESIRIAKVMDDMRESWGLSFPFE